MEISIVGLTKNDFASCLDTLEDIGTRQERLLLYHDMWRGDVAGYGEQCRSLRGAVAGLEGAGREPDTVRRSGDFNKVSQADEPIVGSLMERIE